MNAPDQPLVNRTFEEIEIGETASLVRFVRTDDIRLFAAMSGDVNPAHLDELYAETDIFGHVVVHGMWTAALLSTLLGTRLPGPGTVYLGQDIRFRRPVAPGDTVTAIVTATEKRADKRIVTFDTRCTNQHGEDVLTGTATVIAPEEKLTLPRIPVPEVVLRRRDRFGHRLQDTAAREGSRPAPIMAPRSPAPAGPLSPIVDLSGKRGLVVGIANESSIAYGCARAFRAAGAELAVTYLNARAEPHVRPLAEAVGAGIVEPCDVREPGQLEDLFDRIGDEWGGLDFLLHSIAFAPREDLQTGLVNCSADGFAMAMDVSCHSFIRMARLALPLMRNGGSLQTVSFFGADRVVEGYNLMGPVKAALESTVRTLAADLAAHNIRVHALSTGPVKTRAASGIDRFDVLMDRVRERTPANHLVTVEEIGRIAAFLASDAGAPMTGSVIFADYGFHVVA